MLAALIGAISTDILKCRARVLVTPAQRAGYGRGTLIPDTVLPVHSGDRVVRLSRAVASSRTRPAGPGGRRLSMIMRPRQLIGTSRKPSIGWPQRGPGVRRPFVPSSLLEPRPLCRRYDEAAGLLREVVAFAPQYEDALRGAREETSHGVWCHRPAQKGKPGADHDGGRRCHRPSYCDDTRTVDDALLGSPTCSHLDRGLD